MIVTIGKVSLFPTRKLPNNHVIHVLHYPSLDRPRGFS
jgi:hypothetical protein